MGEKKKKKRKKKGKITPVFFGLGKWFKESKRQLKKKRLFIYRPAHVTNLMQNERSTVERVELTYLQHTFEVRKFGKRLFVFFCFQDGIKTGNYGVTA